MCRKVSARAPRVSRNRLFGGGFWRGESAVRMAGSIRRLRQIHGTQRELPGGLGIFAGGAEVTGIERGLRRLQICLSPDEIGGLGLAGKTLLGRRHRLT